MQEITLTFEVQTLRSSFEVRQSSFEVVETRSKFVQSSLEDDEVRSKLLKLYQFRFEVFNQSSYVPDFLSR